MVIAWCVGTTCLIGPLVIQTYRLQRNHLPRYHKIFTQFCWSRYTLWGKLIQELHSTCGRVENLRVWFPVGNTEFNERSQHWHTRIVKSDCVENLKLFAYVLKMCKKRILEINLTWRKDISKELSYLAACKRASLWPIRHCFTSGDEEKITDGRVKQDLKACNQNIEQETLNLTHGVLSLNIHRYQTAILFWQLVKM